MAKERRDSKNRILGKGEYQKEDGRYMFRYTDLSGKARFVYSWTLTKSDRVPKDRSPGPCLRDLEKEIFKDLAEEIDTFAAKTNTIDDYFEKYISQKKMIKDSTRSRYVALYNLYVKDQIGGRKISSVKFSDIKKYYNDILSKFNITLSSVYNINTVLGPIFRLAVRDGLIRTNPVDGALAEIAKELDYTPNKKEALSVQQQNAFIDFLTDSAVYSKWRPFFTVMLGTGCRVGEMCGLTWDDCDFTNNVIHIRRTVYYLRDLNTGKYGLRIQTPKSKSGYRSIPMLNDVRKILWQERVKQIQTGFSTEEIDGVKGFIFFNSRGKVRIPDNVNNTIHKLISRYNLLEERKAKEDNREPVFMPEFSSHTLRHTFCTRLCETGIDVKVLQQVMGHSKITTTLDIYTSVTQEHKTIAFEGIEGKIRIV